MPISVIKLLSILGLCNLFRSFLPNIAKIVAHFFEECRKREEKSYDSYKNKVAALKIFKERLTFVLVLTLTKRKGYVSFYTDT